MKTLSHFERTVADLFGTLDGAEAGRSVAQFRSLAQANQFRLLYRLATQCLRPGARVLDWGCGNGHFSMFLVRQGAQVTAFSFDPEPEAFALLSPEQRGRITFVRAGTDDPRSLPFADASFDCVFSVGVLEHVRETGGSEAASLREIHRVLQPGGRFVCYHLPNQYSYIEALNRLLYGRPGSAARRPWKYCHPYRYTGRDIHALCGAAGLCVLELHRYGAIPRNVLGRLPPRLRASRPLASAVNALDTLLEHALRPVVQNYAFVAQRG